MPSQKGNHRDRSTRWQNVALIVACIAIGWFITRVVLAEPEPTVYPSALPTETVTSTATATRTVEPGLGNLKATRVGKAMKPLPLLEEGDKVVLWRPNRDREVCRFQEWRSEPDFSTIKCMDDTFTVKTEWLVPGEWFEPTSDEQN